MGFFLSCLAFVVWGIIYRPNGGASFVWPLEITFVHTKTLYIQFHSIPSFHPCILADTSTHGLWFCRRKTYTQPYYLANFIFYFHFFCTYGFGAQKSQPTSEAKKIFVQKFPAKIFFFYCLLSRQNLSPSQMDVC